MCMVQVQYPWSYFWLGNTFPNGTYVQSQTFPVITDAGACILPTRTPTPAPLTVYSTEAPTPGSSALAPPSR